MGGPLNLQSCPNSPGPVAKSSGKLRFEWAGHSKVRIPELFQLSQRSAGVARQVFSGCPECVPELLDLEKFLRHLSSGRPQVQWDSLWTSHPDRSRGVHDRRPNVRFSGSPSGLGTSPELLDLEFSCRNQSDSSTWPLLCAVVGTTL